MSDRTKLLLVDDEFAILLTLKAILDRNNFDVETATSAKEAISKLKRNAYQMVITDMKMEHDKAGYDVIRAAKKTDYNPVVAILTSYPLIGDQWKNEGAHSLLVRPMTTDGLINRIRELLSEQKSRS